MPPNSPSYRAILMDLFWTTIDLNFDDFPQVQISLEGEKIKIPSDGDLLFDEVKRHGVEIERDQFLSGLFSASKKIRANWDQGMTEEISSPEKFANLLREIGILRHAHPKALNDLAWCLTKIHMNCIVESTVMPTDRHELLGKLVQSHRLALVSNFDHAPAGWEILKVHDLEKFFQKVVISDELGKRKPHPQLFQEAMEFLGVTPKETLMVGDSPIADIDGAASLGIDTVWINRDDKEWPKELAPPHIYDS